MECFVLQARRPLSGRHLTWIEILLLSLGLGALSGAGLVHLEVLKAEGQVASLRAELRRAQLRKRSLQQRLEQAQEDPSHRKPTPEAIRQSLAIFQTEFLQPAARAEIQTIREVNHLAAQSGVLLSEIHFSSIGQREATRLGGSGGIRSWPGLEMSFTVEGSYPDVRRFLIALERSQAFLIIHSLDLKSVESGARSGQPPSGTAQETGVIALGVKLSLYYQWEAKE